LLVAAAATTTVAAVAARQSLAANKTYNGPSGNWSTITWVPAGQPINGDVVTIGNGAGGVVTVTYDAGATANSLNQITLDATNAGSVTLAQAQGAMSITGTEYVGFAGTGALNLSAGSQTFTSSSFGNGLYLGFNSGASGTVTLSGTAVLNLSNSLLEEYIGYSGNGAFLQSGGSNTTFYLTMGYNASGTNVGSGVYTQTGGTLNVTSGEYVGYSGNGVVNQSGGFNTAASLFIGSNANGTNAAASGVYSMSNGASLSVTNSFLVGLSGSGTFNQTGGNATASSGITLASSPGGTGVVNLSGGTFTSPTLTINNASAFHQTGGTVNLSSINNALLIGNATATATYTLDGANSTLSVTGSELVGNGGNGTLVQTAGVNTANTLLVGQGGTGFYNLFQGSATFNAAYIGGSTSGAGGAGSLLVTAGGTFTVAQTLKIWNSGTSVVNLNGGVITVGLIDTSGAPARFNWTAGTLNYGNDLFVDTVSTSPLGSALALGNNQILSIFNSKNEFVGNGGTGSITQNGGSNSVNSLYLGFSNSASGSYTLAGSGALTAFLLNVGESGTGNFTQSGGVNNVSFTLNVGNQAGGLGTYTMGGGLLSVNHLVIGSLGQGTSTQSGGTSALNTLDVGSGAGGVGIYNLSGNAVLGVLTSEGIGDNGVGTFNQTGGSHSANSLVLGANASFGGTGFGSFNLSGGSLNVATSETVGGDGYGAFTQNGGSNVAATLALGTAASPGNPGTGTYTLNAGLLQVAGAEYVGSNTRGVFIQTGGTHTLGAIGGNGLFVGYLPSSAGTVNLSGGTLSLTNGTTYVGYFGSGVFNQTGGALLTGDLAIADLAFGGTNSGSTGVYTLSGSNATLTVSNEFLTYSVAAGSSTFNQSAGTHTVNIMQIGDSSTFPATYNLSGGTLSLHTMFLGYVGNGAFNQSGGSNAVSLALYVGYGISGTNPASSGTYTLSAGVLNASSANENVGISGTGLFNQSGGINTAVYLNLGQNPNSFGTYNLSNGATLQMNGGSVGVAGNGVFNQTGGTFNLGGTNGNPQLFVGQSQTANGTVNLSGGAMIGANFFLDFVGYLGRGVFNQSGGSNSIYYLRIGSGSAATGIYNLSGGSLAVGFDEFVGQSGSGTFVQSGGTHTTQYLNIGNGTFATSSGLYTMTGGTLSVFAEEYEGLHGFGTFNHSGGTNSVGNLYLGYYTNGAGVSPASGIYNMSNGATLAVAGNENVGLSGNGLFNQTGGTHTIGGEFYLGTNPTGNGTFVLSGGILSVTNGSTAVGYSGVGSFTQSGGSHAIGAWLYAGYNPGSTGSYNLSGGSLSATVESIGYGGAGTFNQTGGSNAVGWGGLTIAANAGSTGSYNFSGGYLTASVINNGSFTQTGGTFSGTFTNNLTFTYGGGNFNGAFIHESTATFTFLPSANYFAAYGGMTNYGTLTIGPGQTIAAVPMDIEGGAVILSGGNITGGDLLNNGSISGYGSIAAAGFTNNAVITQGAGNLYFSASSNALNNGQIDLALGRQFQIGGTTNLTNAGTFNVNGAQVTGTNSLVNLASGVLSGPGLIAAPLSNAGTVLVPVGTFNIVQPFSNAGLIQLTAPGASLIGGTITNTGTIQGVGSVGSPLSNLGTIEALGTGIGGGTLNLAGSVTNTASGLLRASTGNKLLISGGLSTNFGTIDLVGGTFDNNSHPLTNAGSIAGFGILSTSGLTNAPGRTITLSGGFTTVNGDVTNSAGATLRAALNPVLFTGNVVNNGSIKVTGAPTNTVTIAGTYSGSGSYVSDPADNYFLSDVNVSGGGLISGATGDRFFISGTYVNAGTYNNNGGSLSGQNVINTGSFNQLAGQATLLALSGTGATTVGGGAGTALVSVSSLSQGAVTINSGGTLTIRPAGSRLTNTAANLQINGTGTLDLGNHELLTNTAPNTIKTYLANAYDPNGNADWGQPGLTSSVARNNPISYSLGYANGSDQSSQDAGVTTHNGTPLGASETIIRPVLTGDANMDGSVDFFDITQILGYKYNTNQQASYTDGDLDYSGHVDFFDIVMLLSANYNSGQSYLGAHAASPTLTSTADAHVASSSSAIASATTIGVPGDGKPDFEYDPATGHLRFRTDGGTFTTTGGTSSFVSSLTISSASGILIPGGASAVFANGTGATLTANLLSSALTNTPGFSDGFDIGLALPPGLDAATLTADLTVKYQSLNGGALKIADITFMPEPASLALLTFGAAGLIARRHRRGRERRRIPISLGLSPNRTPLGIPNDRVARPCTMWRSCPSR
jgi:hypothetical protein